jgi:hypothetical protein
MKTIIGVSNFSFDTPHFNSFDSLATQFIKLKSLRADYNLTKVSISIANDITKDKWFGPSIDEQIRNFEFGKDRGAITSFKVRLERDYLRGFERSFKSSELKEKAGVQPCAINNENTILYIPTNLITGYANFRDRLSFCEHYEYILGHFPIDNENYYEKATSYFDNLIFQEGCRDTLDKVDDNFCNYTVAFTKCLKALNDSSPTKIISTQKKLADIRSKANYHCTAEGNSHKNFKFKFTHSNKNYSALDCQFHLKPSDRNTKGDGSHNHKRLYFGFIPLSTKEWKIAVASMGPHISTHNDQDRFAPQKILRKKIRRKGNS